MIHLMCIGIPHKASEVQWHPNVQIICNKCLKGEQKSSKPSAAKPSTPKTSQRQTNIAQFISNDKVDEILTLLQGVEKTVTDTYSMVASNVQTSKSYSDVLKDIKEVTVSTNEQLKAKPNVASYANVARRNINLSPFPSLNSPIKRRRVEDRPPPKTQFKGRALTAGTATIVDHGLGDTVALNKPNNMNRPKRDSPYAHLTKSIYISRLQPNVSSDKITNFIKSKVPDLNEKDVSLRMLVKKDQPLDQLTFISYRLSCTEEHFSKFMESSFWPQHVMIGEFIEREREQVNLGDFFGGKPVEKNAGSPKSSDNTNNSDEMIVEIIPETNK